MPLSGSILCCLLSGCQRERAQQIKMKNKIIHKQYTEKTFSCIINESLLIYMIITTKISQYIGRVCACLCLRECNVRGYFLFVAINEKERRKEENKSNAKAF